MRKLVGFGIGIGIAVVVGTALAQAAPPKAFRLGDVFVDSNGDTLQVVQCRGQGWSTECKVRRLAESGSAPIDPSGRWWSLDVLRGSERSWVMNGGTKYAGPAVPLPGAAAPGGAPATDNRPRAAPGRAAALPAPPPAAAGGACPKSTYGGIVKANVPASAALFRQKITDTITMGSYGRGWYGLILADFKVGSPVRNGVGQLPGGGAARVNNGAPVGAAMYPVSTTMTVCEGWPGGSGSWRTSAKKYLCFVSANREWTCGASN